LPCARCLALLRFALIRAYCRIGLRHMAEGRGFAVSVYHFAGWRTTRSSPLSSSCSMKWGSWTEAGAGSDQRRNWQQTMECWAEACLSIHPHQPMGVYSCFREGRNSLGSSSSDYNPERRARTAGMSYYHEGPTLWIYSGVLGWCHYNIHLSFTFQL
jgi:hypothetical protein